LPSAVQAQGLVYIAKNCYSR